MHPKIFVAGLIFFGGFVHASDTERPPLAKLPGCLSLLSQKPMVHGAFGTTEFQRALTDWNASIGTMLNPQTHILIDKTASMVSALERLIALVPAQKFQTEKRQQLCRQLAPGILIGQLVLADGNLVTRYHQQLCAGVQDVTEALFLSSLEVLRQVGLKG
jgi:hypothetical protein